MTVDSGPSEKTCPFCVAKIPESAQRCEACGADFTAESWASRARGIHPQPVWHLVALGLATFGLYYIYWYYRSWRQVGQYTGKKMSPGWRTVGLFVPILGLVFIYDLFDDVQQMLALKGLRPTIRAGWLLVMLIGLGGCWRLPDPLSFIGFLMVVPLAIVQSDMNRLWTQTSPGTYPKRLSGLEMGILIVGGLVVMLAIFGTFIPE